MNTLNITQAAAYLNRSVKTLQRYNREGLLVPTRTPKNRRVYTVEQLDAFLGQRREQKTPHRIIAYCRVSSVAQRPALTNQRRTLEDFCVARGLAPVEYIEEVGGGLHFTRKKFNQLMDAVVNDEVKILVIAHKDRLCRFGFEWFDRLCQQYGCTLFILNNESLSDLEIVSNTNQAFK
jgi:predicted site-specific integrase-resolvase